MATQESNKDGADDLAILHPERQAKIAGVDVTMREYTHLEGLRLHALIAPIVAGIKAVTLAGVLPDLEALQSVFGNNPDDLMQLQAVACDQPVKWVSALPDGAGRDLELLWWEVNSHFFTSRVLESLTVHQLKEFVGLTFTQPSHALDTTLGNLAATRNVN